MFRRFAKVIILFCWSTAVATASEAAGQETLVGIVGKDFVLLGADSSFSQGFALTASNLDKIAPLVEPFEYDKRGSFRSSTHQQHHQQTIVAAAAGDAAMSDRLVGNLKAFAAIQEYDAGVGCDVQFIAATGKQQSSSSLVEPGLSVKSMAYYARSQLAKVRPQGGVCLLIAGMMLCNEDSDGDMYVSRQLQRQLQNALENGDSVEVTASKEVLENDANSFGAPAAPSGQRLEPHLYWLDELGSAQKLRYGAHGLGSNFCLSILDQGYRQDMSLDEATLLLRDCFQQLRTRYVINSPQPPCIKCVDANGLRLIR